MTIFTCAPTGARRFYGCTEKQLKSMNKFYTEVFGILPKLKGTK